MESLSALLLIEKFIDSGDVIMLHERGHHVRLKGESRALLESVRENLKQIFQSENEIYTISEIKVFQVSDIGFIYLQFHLKQ